MRRPGLCRRNVVCTVRHSLPLFYAQVLLPTSPPAAVWRAGESVEVSWGIRYPAVAR